MKEQLPMTPVIYLEWDPSSESCLAIGLRGFGIALWKAGSGVGCQMWAGMGETWRGPRIPPEPRLSLGRSSICFACSEYALCCYPP